MSVYLRSAAHMVALLAGAVSTVLFTMALDVGPFSTITEPTPGLTIDHSGSSIAGIPIGKLATIRDHHPLLVPWAWVFFFIAFFLEFALVVVDLVAASHERAKP